MLHVNQLYIYPIKSLGGISVTEARVTPTGLEHDRRWMLVDEQNKFLSQRTLPQLVHFKLQLTTEGLQVQHQQSEDSIVIPYQPQTQEYAQVKIWDDICTGQFVSAEADAWFTAQSGLSCRLVYMPDSTQRQVDLRYAQPGQITSFSDAYPILLISQESLDDLNSRLPEPLPMNRFRPNIVCSGGEPYIEDMLAQFDIGGIHFYGAKLCARCIMTGVDQDTAQTGVEPLKTLATYRKRNNKIYLGQNLLYNSNGVIKTGEVLNIHKMANVQPFG
ncbi:MOSC domain-containing protein [Mucilaginibacter lacusdianchii]|uniref:MOSC domain-containing protein n=1 Tax=Mucilaginibacter lacusdianchii TaxID=2684211 RepID=UPI00131DA298|nr:MOSC N-terminal beta barrel domain-containing protein [Mucilaginibacter sp. JXJ CY 39]